MTDLTDLNNDQLDVIHELILRGLGQTDPADREYGEAYDAFVDAADYPLRIGDQPDRVRKAWHNVIQETDR